MNRYEVVDKSGDVGTEMRGPQTQPRDRISLQMTILTRSLKGCIGQLRQGD